MPKDVFAFRCPCCSKHIEVNVRSGKARAAKPQDADQNKDIDTLLDVQKTEQERLGSAFDEAQRDQQRNRDRLRKLFESAKEDAKDDETKPTNPFDLE
jgi:hypothetical protein